MGAPSPYSATVISRCRRGNSIEGANLNDFQHSPSKMRPMFYSSNVSKPKPEVHLECLVLGSALVKASAIISSEGT